MHETPFLFKAKWVWDYFFLNSNLYSRASVAFVNQDSVAASAPKTQKLKYAHLYSSFKRDLTDLYLPI